MNFLPKNVFSCYHICPIHNLENRKGDDCLSNLADVTADSQNKTKIIIINIKYISIQRANVIEKGW